MTHRTAPVVRRFLSPSSLAFALAIAFGAQACSCAVGRPDDSGDAAIDVPVVPTDGGYDSGPLVDAGDAGDSGTVDPCGDGIIDSESGEVCDPNLPLGSLDELRCICPPDATNCTDDTWVPNPSQGLCYGSCQHPPRSGYGINTCDDGDPCTVDLITSGTVEACDVVCSNEPFAYIDQPTTCGSGPCASTGKYSCVDGMQVDSCMPGTPGGTDNNCDGADNNCNGSVDEGYVPIGTNCGVGACASTGLSTCTNGMTGTTCVAGTPGLTDNTCNNVDDNCNAFVDEGYTPVLTSCGMGACASTGSTSCVPGGYIANSCMAGSPNPEICDSIDNDCDGVLNDGNPGGGEACTTANLGRCSAGITNCVSGGIVCTQTFTAIAETCNNIDDNCNGMTDEGLSGLACSTGMAGACSAGTSLCTSATGVTSCVQTNQPSAEICDLVDNNCDGTLNNGIPSVACTSANPGICQPGTTSCNNANGMTLCNSTIAPGSQQEICIAGGGVGPGDGLDNDCDGTADINPRVNDGMPNLCGDAASRTVNVGVGGTQTVVGNVDADDGFDYLLVNFQGATSGGAQYRPKFTIASNGNVYQFSLFTNTGCGTPITSPCGASGGNLYQTWEVLYTGDQLQCSSASDGSHPATCSDTFARVTSYVVRIRRTAASPQINCTNYTLTITN